MEATAVAHPNIALVKYWGKRDLALNLPAVSSLSLTLAPFHTRTTVRWGIAGSSDEVMLDGVLASPAASAKVSRFLDLIEPDRPRCRVISRNDFPTAAGLASSSSGFAALALAGAAAAGQPLDRVRLSRLARQGSGSACRSLWGGFVLWRRGERLDGEDSHGAPIPTPAAFSAAVVVAIVSAAKKVVGSTEGMERSRESSPTYGAWLSESEAWTEEGLAALAAGDLPRLGAVMERSTLLMHATMLTSLPSIRYWRPATLAVLDAVDQLRAAGIGAWATMDAGPNVKILCAPEDAPAVLAQVAPLVPRALVLESGGDARLEPTP